MANSYNPEFTLTLQGCYNGCYNKCYITVMVFGVYHGVRMFSMFIFHDLRAFQQLEFNYII